MSALLDLDADRLGRCPNCDRWMELVCSTCLDFDHADLLDRLAIEARRLRAGIEQIAKARCLRDRFPPGCAGTCVTCQARALLDVERCPTCGAGDGDEHDLDQHERER